MIGVVSSVDDRIVVEEFFELFKTPWEFYKSDQTDYDVLIVADENMPNSKAPLIIIYTSERLDFNERIEAGAVSENSNGCIKSDKTEIPIYGKSLHFPDAVNPILFGNNSDRVIGYEFYKDKQRIIRIGYDLFKEVFFLLTTGQPSEKATIPTLDLHIALLRKWIIESGAFLIEIPPVPLGYGFITCLTHDIDFIRIRDHKFDRTMWGFLYRATVGTLFDLIKKRRSWKELYQNWKAALTLPFVYIGLFSDFWFKFDRYMELEESVDARSTFFFIPFKNRMGEKDASESIKGRAAKYDVTDIQDTLKMLVNRGFEVGVHGIDAWHNPEAASREKARIANISGKKDVGIRMHWLYFDRNTYHILDQAGFFYDTTFGYNDAVGYRAGTSQVFKPINGKKIFELPLHIQDTALFNPKHMSLKKTDAWQHCQEVIEKTSLNTGILTILWHGRSLSPERLYEDFYIDLLSELKSRKAWFATATNACKWFENRRSVKFESIKADGNIIQIKVSKVNNDALPSMMLRVFKSDKNNKKTEYTDLPWQSESEFLINV